MTTKCARTTRQDWTTGMVGQIHKEIKSELINLAASKTADAPPDGANTTWLLARIEALGCEDTATSRLRRFLYARLFLKRQLLAPRPCPLGFKRAFDLALALLKRQRIAPDNPQFGHLYRDLFSLQSQWQCHHGDHMAACWHQLLGIKLSKNLQANPLQEDFDALLAANRVFRLGHASLALERYRRLDHQHRGDLGWRIRIHRLRALRLSGHYHEAHELLSKTAVEFPQYHQNHTLLWETLCLNVVLNQELTAMSQAIGNRGHLRHPPYRLEGILWVLAGRKRSLIAKLPKARAIKRQDYARRSPGLRAYQRAVVAIQECYDSDQPLAQRLHQLGHVLPETKGLLNIDKELLVWAATYRFLQRVKALPLSDLALAEYQRISRHLSNYHNPDVLNQFSEVPHDAT